MILEVITIAIASFTFTEILTEQGMVFSWYYRLISKLPDWLFKPLGGCCYCLAGQMALWLFLWLHIGQYNPLTHIGYICSVIFTTHVFLTINHKLNGTD